MLVFRTVLPISGEEMWLVVCIVFFGSKQQTVDKMTWGML